MKTTKILSLLCLSIMFWSCSEDEPVISLTQPTFEITPPAGESGLFTFENTTPNKGEFFSFWVFEVGGSKAADKNGPVEHLYTSSGPKIVTLTMVSSETNLQTSQAVTVTLPPPPDMSFSINPENLVANGYFDNGDGNDFTNWSKNNGADNFTEERSDVLVGNRAVRVINPAPGPEEWRTQFVTDAFPTTNGEVYTASLWIKGGAVSVRFSTNPGVGGDQYAGGYTASADWTQYSWTFTANSATTLLALDMGKDMGEFIIDAVEVVKGDKALDLPSNDSALLNGDLEAGEGDDFTNWSKNNNADGITVELNDVLSGGRAAKISNATDGPDEWRTQFVSDAFATDNGSAYTASVWIKGDPVEIRFSTNPGVGGDQYAGNYTATSNWTKYSWTFNANSDTTLLALDMGKNAGNFIIDAIKVVKN